MTIMMKLVVGLRVMGVEEDLLVAEAQARAVRLSNHNNNTNNKTTNNNSSHNNNNNDDDNTKHYNKHNDNRNSANIINSV